MYRQKEVNCQSKYTMPNPVFSNAPSISIIIPHWKFRLNHFIVRINRLALGKLLENHPHGHLIEGCGTMYGRR